MYITNTVNTNSVNDSEIFTYDINATFRNDNNSLISPTITTYFPNNISYYLPDKNEDLIDIQIISKDDGDYITFIFNSVRSGFNYNLLIAANYSTNRSENDTFENTTTLYIDDVEIEEATADSVKFNVTTNLTVSLEHDANANLKSGDTINALMYLTQQNSYGASENNLVITSTLTGNYTINPKYTPTGYDVSPNHSDTHLDGNEGIITDDNKSLTFSMDYFSGEKYAIEFQLIVNEDASADDELYLSTKFSVDETLKESLEDYFYVRSEPIDLDLKVTSPTFIAAPANATVETLLSNTSDSDIEYGELIITVPENVTISQFKFLSSINSIAKYTLYYTSKDISTYTSLYTDTYGDSPNTLISDLLNDDDYITGFKIEFDDLIANSYENHFKFSYTPINNETSSYTTAAVLNVNYESNIYTFTSSSETTTYDKSVYKTELVNVEDVSYITNDDEFYLELKLIPDKGATLEPVLIYEIPDNFTYIQNSIYFSFYDDYLDKTFYSYDDDFLVDSHYYIETLFNYNETGINLIRVRFQYLGITAAQSLSMFIKVKFTGHHKDAYKNIGYLGGSYEYVSDYSSITDTYDFDGDNDKTDIISNSNPIYMTNTYSSNISLTNLISTDNINYSDNISISSNDTFTSKLEIFNTHEDSLSNITIVDILPHNNDNNIIYETDYRYSTNSVYLNGEITLKVLDTITNTESNVDNYEVYYSNGYNPTRFDYLNLDIGEDEWYNELEDIKAFKIVLDPSFTLMTNEKLIVYVPLVNNYTASNKDIATNTFAISASTINTNNEETILLPLESTDTYINTTTDEEFSIIGYTFIDNNKDGIYDKDDSKINNIEISLYDTDKNLLKSIYSSEDGYFSFNSLEKGTYYLTSSTPDDYTFTKEVATDEFGSKINGALEYNPITVEDQNITDYYIGFIAKTDKIPSITISDNIVILKSDFDPMSIVSAYDYLGNDITSNVIVNYNDVNTFITGNYTVKYSVTDAYGNSNSEWFYIYVKSEDEIDRTNSINNLLSSSTLVDSSIASIINSESDKLNAVINNATNTTELIDINNSVDCMMKKITNLSIVNRNKINITKDCSCN